MIPSSGQRHLLGTRLGTRIGAFLVIQFSLVLAVKTYQGETEQIWWLSHVALLVAGIGFVQIFDGLQQPA